MPGRPEVLRVRFFFLRYGGRKGTVDLSTRKSEGKRIAGGAAVKRFARNCSRPARRRPSLRRREVNFHRRAGAAGGEIERAPESAARGKLRGTLGGKKFQ